jgi:hypothetical protein
MSDNASSTNDLWRIIASHYDALQRSVVTFLSTDIDRVGMIRLALRNGDLPAVLYVAQFLRESELKELFPEWVDLVSQAHRYIAQARNVMHSLPRDWVIANIEGVAEPILQNGTEDEYRRFLEMYRELDPNLTLRLAQRAVQSQDTEIKEAGRDFLESLKI